jgi:hypothetical protein
MSNFTEEELERAEFYFDDAKQEITIIVRGGGGDWMDIRRIENKAEYFRRKLKGK